MRLLLAAALTLLFIWFQNAEDQEDMHENPCKAGSSTESAVSFLLLPLSLYSWLTSTMLRLVLSVPALLLSSLHHTLLLLLAGPWCIISFCVSILLTALHVALYLLHLALVIWVGAIMIFMRHKMANRDISTTKEKMLQLKKKKAENRLRFFGRRVLQQG